MAELRKETQAPRVLVVAPDAELRASALAALEGWNSVQAVQDDAALLAAVVSDRGGFQRFLLQGETARLDPALVEALGKDPTHAMIIVLPQGAQPGEIRALLEEQANTATLRGAGVRPDGLLLRYQPIVCLHTGRVVMVEALARWASEPVALTPGNFIPAMERMGLGRALAGAVTRMAARDVALLRLRPSIGVSINLSVAEFSSPGVVGWLGRQLRRARLPRGRLAIELTETSPIVDRARMHRSLRCLRRAGHDVMMDDYILNDPRRRLLRLPFSGVKLDRSLVQLLPGSARARHEVRALAGMGLTLTAEGVSTPELWRRLRGLGVARAQGFLIAHPLPATALPAWARKWRSAQPRKASP